MASLWWECIQLTHLLKNMCWPGHGFFQTMQVFYSSFTGGATGRNFSQIYFTLDFYLLHTLFLLMCLFFIQNLSYSYPPHTSKYCLPKKIMNSLIWHARPPQSSLLPTSLIISNTNLIHLPDLIIHLIYHVFTYAHSFLFIHILYICLLYARNFARC